MPSEKTSPSDARQPREQTDDATRDSRREATPPASFTGDASNADLGRGATTTPARDAPRTAIDMTPGIPAGSGRGIDEALRQPDTELGGAVAGDTTPQGETGDKPSADVVRAEDKDRTTL